jgi:membrane fusion protein, multidrug efflux system
MQKTVRVTVGSILLVLVVAGIGAGLAWIKFQQIQAAQSAPPPPEAPIAVRFGVASPCTIRQSTTSIGTILAPRSITIRMETSGVVRKMGLVSGQIIEENALIFELDRSVEEAQLASAEARLKIADSTFRRMQMAADANAVTELELDQSKAELEQAQAEIDRNKAIIAKKTMLAPFRARAGLINTYEGQYLSEGSTIGTLQSVDDFVHVDFVLPENVAHFVEIGHDVQLHSDGNTLKAKIVARDSQADRVTRNLLARARLDNPPKFLLPNDSIRVSIEYGPEMKVLSVPMTSVRRSPTGAFVFVTEKDAEGNIRVKQRQVKVGQTNDSGVIVVSGLQPNEQVVADGSFKLRDGALVAEVNSTPAATNVPSTAETTADTNAEATAG